MTRIPTLDPPTSSAAPLAFRQVPKTGVIYVTSEATRMGYRPGAADWCNLGQGQPETGPLEHAPPRVREVTIDLDQEYAPVAGLWELREAVAGLYNHLFRRGLKSQYSAENVAISGGGRAGLTRVAASLGSVNVGHFLPDYTAYEELLDIFSLFSPMPISLEAERAYAFSVEDLRREVVGRGLAALLLSNPCNPTGKLVAGDELESWVSMARELDCCLLLDEFYSHYIWRGADEIVSAARYVEDVDSDPVVIMDGLTKNWRYPAWRVTWTVAPKSVIDGVASAGSFLDGGGSKPLQRAAIPLLSPELVLAETRAIHETFGRKRRVLLDGIHELGLRLDRAPDGTFYAWASVAGLPPPLDDGMSFFRHGLSQKLICVPGEFFDVNPGKRRVGRPSRFRRHVRLSFGPSEETMRTALGRLKILIDEARAGRLG